MNITHFSQHLSGINDAMIANEPPASTVIPWFINSIQNLTIVGYNVNFDINALNEEANRLGMSGISVSNVIDVIDIARQSLPNSPSYSLEQVAILLNVSDTEKHRALDDAILTWKCWQKMESMNNKQIILSQEQVTTVSQRNSKIRNDKTKHVLLSRYLDNSSDPINQKPSGREIISYDRGENLTGWKNHQEILAHYGYDAWLWVYVIPGVIKRGKYKGEPTYDVYLDGELIGNLTSTIYQYHQGQVPPEGAVMIAHIRDSANDKSLGRYQVRLQMPERN